MHKDCFAYGEKCSVFNKTYCLNGECSFYKPKDEHDEYLIKHHGTENMDIILQQYPQVNLLSKIRLS